MKKRKANELKDGIGTWVSRPLRCEECGVNIENVDRYMTFYCDNCCDAKANYMRIVRLIQRGNLGNN